MRSLFTFALLTSSLCFAQTQVKDSLPEAGAVDSVEVDSLGVDSSGPPAEPVRPWTLDFSYSGMPSGDGSSHGLSLGLSRAFELFSVRVVPSLAVSRQIQIDPDTAWNDAVVSLGVSRGIGSHLSFGLAGWVEVLTSPQDYGGSSSLTLQSELWPGGSGSLGGTGAWSLSGSWSGSGRLALGQEIAQWLDASVAGSCTYAPLTDLPLATNASNAPYVPQWGADGSLDFSFGDWSVSPQGSWAWFKYTKSTAVATKKSKQEELKAAKSALVGSYEVLAWSTGASVGWSATPQWWLWSSFTWGWNSENSNFRLLDAGPQKSKQGSKWADVLGESTTQSAGSSWGAGASYSF